MENLMSFSPIRRKQKLTKTVTYDWYVEDFLTDWMSLTLSRQWLRLYVSHSAPSHRAKVTQQFLRQNTPDFIAADEWASYSRDLNPLDYCIWDILQDLVYEGRRHPCRHLFANLQNLEEAIKTTEGHHWDSSKIHCAMEKRLNVVRKQNGGTIRHIFC